MRHLLLPVILLTAGALAPPAPAAPPARAAEPAWTVRGHLPVDQFIVQAHRGAGDLSEENSLEAFQLGWKLNCIPEADVRVTQDGVIVAFHDKDFSRVVKGASPALAKQGVRDLTWDEVLKLDIGTYRGEQFAGRRVPKLSDVFDLMKGKPERRLYLDIKEVDLDNLAKEAKAAGVEKQVIFASTKYDLLRGWRQRVPDGQTLLWLGGDEKKLEQRFEEIRKTGYADITQVQIHTRLPEGQTNIQRDAANPFNVSDAFLRARGEELRKQGIVYQTLPWGATGKEVYWKLLDLGFMSFATDHPEVTWAAIREWYGEAK